VAKKLSIYLVLMDSKGERTLFQCLLFRRMSWLKAGGSTMAALPKEKNVVEARIAGLESDVSHIRSKLTEVQADAREAKEGVNELRVTVAEMRGDMGILRSDMHTLRSDMNTLRSDMKAAIASVRVWVLTIIGGLALNLAAVLVKWR
jgi:outer membrane murein-binding lipoprotein Lpp